MGSDDFLRMTRAADRNPLLGESGAVTIIVAMTMVTLLLFFGIVVMAAGWAQHKRALQNQVDAAALAGGQRWTCGDDTRSAAQSEAGKYIGLNARPTGASSYGWTPTFDSSKCQL